MGLPQVVLTPLGERLYPPQILFAPFLRAAAGRFELVAQRLYLPLLRPYDVLEFQLPLCRCASQGLHSRHLTIVASALLLGQPPCEVFTEGTLQVILSFRGSAAGRLEFGSVARLLFLVRCPELLLPMLGGVFQGFDLLPVPRLQGFTFTPELFLDGVEARPGGGGIHVGLSLFFEPAANLCELLYVLVADAELLVRVLLFECGDLRPEVGHLLLQGLDQGAGRLHALSERSRLIPGILAHDRFS